MANGNGGFNIQEILGGNFTIYLDFEYSTIFKLMLGLIVVGVISAVVANRLIKG